MLLGNMTISFANFFTFLEKIPLIGRMFKGWSEGMLTAGGHIVNALHQSSNALASFSQKLAVPAGVDAFAQKLDTVAAGAEQFAMRAKKSFNSVKEEVTRVTSTSSALTQPLDDATTETGELVKVSGNIGVMFDKATGSITAMNRELFGTLTLMREINAAQVAPVQ
jgi:methyl-accepting chemotaxis protein